MDDARVSQATNSGHVFFFHAGEARPEINDTLYFYFFRDSAPEICVLGTWFMAALHGNTHVNRIRTYKPIIVKMLPF